MIDTVFDRVRELVAPFGFDVILLQEPRSDTAAKFIFHLSVRANCRSKGKELRCVVAYSRHDLWVWGKEPERVKRLPFEIARDLLSKTLALLDGELPDSTRPAPPASCRYSAGILPLT